MAIRFDPENRRPVDDDTGEYLKHEFHHFENPLHHYRLQGPDGETRLIADVAERRLDTTGDKTVDRIEASIFRIFGQRYDGKIVRVWSRWHPAARRFTAFYKTLLRNQQTNNPDVVISFKLWSRLPHSER